MKMKDFNNLKIWFLKYSDRFLEYPDIDIENIILKKEHTLRVCENMKLISKDLSPNDKILALAVALLHDVGRFEQWRIYRTFSDQKSEDHALLGVRILKDLNILKTLDPLEVELILIAVENHNKAQIMTGLSKRAETISKLVRDADKLDIWHVVIEYYKDGREKTNPSLVHNLPFGTDVCTSVFNAVGKKGIIPYKLLETVVDMKIFQMGWVYDLNTNYAVELTIKRGYLEDIFNTLPKTDRISHLYKSMKEYLSETLTGEHIAST